jgi:excisionase family DNA binding protein
MHDYEAGLIGIKALAAHLAISIRGVHRLIASGELPSLKLGRRRVVSRDAVNEWLSDRAQHQIGNGA